MAILVTGAAGFIGAASALALLERGQQVVGIDNLNPYYDPKLKQARLDRISYNFPHTFKFLNVDFSDAESLLTSLQGMELDSILHLGAQAGVRYSIENPATYLQANIVGHGNLLELARNLQVSHFVYASSSSVYGHNPKVPFSVSARADHPVSLYAATKRADELMSEAYANIHRLPATGLRFFTVYGPWGRPDMAIYGFTQALFEGRPIKLYNRGDMRRDFTYIDDVVAGVMAALERPPRDDSKEKPGGSTSPHAIYNLGNNQAEPLGRMVELLERATGRTANLVRAPMQPGDVTATWADIPESERDLGYRPATPIDEGLPRFVEWYREYHGKRTSQGSS